MAHMKETNTIQPTFFNKEPYPPPSTKLSLDAQCSEKLGGKPMHFTLFIWWRSRHLSNSKLVMVHQYYPSRAEALKRITRSREVKLIGAQITIFCYACSMKTNSTKRADECQNTRKNVSALSRKSKQNWY